MNTPRLTSLIVIALAVAATATLMPTAQACGGEYPAAVQGDTGQGVTYCSDGTFGGLGVPAPGGYDNPDCSDYAVSVEADTGEGSYYCSDGTISPFLGLLP